jgi:hypothetical protein
MCALPPISQRRRLAENSAVPTGSLVPGNRCLSARLEKGLGLGGIRFGNADAGRHRRFWRHCSPSYATGWLARSAPRQRCHRPCAAPALLGPINTERSPNSPELRQKSFSGFSSFIIAFIRPGHDHKQSDSAHLKILEAEGVELLRKPNHTHAWTSRRNTARACDRRVVASALAHRRKSAMPGTSIGSDGRMRWLTETTVGPGTGPSNL